MGLDSFASSGTNTSRTKSSANTGQTDSKSNDSEKEEDTEPFKVVSGDRGREKVFPTEEDWEETVEVVEDDLHMSIGEVMNKSAEERHQVLHQAILKKNGIEQDSFIITRECIVCGETFVFPNKWNFTEFKNEASCNDHSIAEVVEEVGKVNSIQG